MKKINIAIDGLSSTGKGMTSKFLAKELKYNYLDTGAMYRGLTYFLKKQEIKPENVDESSLSNITLDFNQQGHLLINKQDREHLIRSEEISKLTPSYAKEKFVRYFVNKQLKKIVSHKGYIAEGRDIASHIMPHAEIKIFLSGNSQIRAKRRQEQLKLKGILENVEEVKKDLEARDHADINRDIAPLVKHKDAIEIDTSNLSLDEQNTFILNLIKKYLNMKNEYPIGTPGIKWGTEEKKQWLLKQKKQRSYSEHVLDKLIELKENFKISQYGTLNYTKEGFCDYSLQILTGKHWNKNKKTILITGGVHGYETSGVKGALQFAKEKYIKYSNIFNFIIVPCVSPWGFETINRWNPHTIDVNRTFKNKGECDEARLLMEYLSQYKNEIIAHFDLHETTNSDITEFRPAKYAKDQTNLFNGEIPDGFYIIGNKNNHSVNFEKAIIHSTKKVTHIAQIDKKGEIIGNISTCEGVLNLDIHNMGVCFGLTEAKYAITTEVYPDSKKTTPQECIDAQVAAIIGGIEWILKNN